MNSIVGFTAISQETGIDSPTENYRQNEALIYFGNLNQLSLNIGATTLILWGHNDLSQRVHQLTDGTFLCLIGLPVGKVSWTEIEDLLNRSVRPEDFDLPWDGRVILLRISSDGRTWIMWNDWCGSIPVYYARTKIGRFASTLEPEIVDAARFSLEDIYLPSLMSLLIHGHYVSDWTLFEGMRVIPPDCLFRSDEDGETCKQFFSVKPSDKRWESSWNDLIDEMHELLRQSISESLKSCSTWILPLSGGLDSRTIAAVGAELNTNLYTYTYGSATTKDVIHARQIAHALRLPWKRIELGTDYLTDYSKMWADWFGSAMHFHGMYQIPFLEALETEPQGPVAVGFLGESLAGSHIAPMAAEYGRSNKHLQLLPTGWLHWPVNEIEALCKFRVTEPLEMLSSEIQKQFKAAEGAIYQKLMLLDFWNRQRLFIRFQTTLCDYWRGAATPFLNKKYARFCMSLPKAALEDRRLLKDVYRRYYGKLAAIPGTYSQEPLLLTGSYLLKRRIAKNLPRALRFSIFQEFSSTPVLTDRECVKLYGWDAFWPIRESWQELNELIDSNRLTDTYNAVLNSTVLNPIRKLQSVQTLAFRLLK